MDATLFTYGMLSWPEVMGAITTGRHEAHPARLLGHRCLCVAAADYPGVVPGGGEVSGVVYFDVSPDSLARLDRFEGEMYERLERVVTLAGGREVPAQVYIVVPAQRASLLDVPWDRAAYGRDRLAHAIEVGRRFRLEDEAR